MLKFRARAVSPSQEGFGGSRDDFRFVALRSLRLSLLVDHIELGSELFSLSFFLKRFRRSLGIGYESVLRPTIPALRSKSA
jgi:hypothetical protein